MKYLNFADYCFFAISILAIIVTIFGLLQTLSVIDYGVSTKILTYQLICGFAGFFVGTGLSMWNNKRKAGKK